MKQKILDTALLCRKLSLWLLVIALMNVTLASAVQPTLVRLFWGLALIWFGPLFYWGASCAFSSEPQWLSREGGYYLAMSAVGLLLALTEALACSQSYLGFATASIFFAVGKGLFILDILLFIRCVAAVCTHAVRTRAI